MRLNEPASTPRRQALQTLAAGTALLTLAGCGRRDDPQGPVNFWTMGREAEVVAELLPAFRARFPEIQVRVQQLPWTAAHEKLLTAYAGDALPDWIRLGVRLLPQSGPLAWLVAKAARFSAARLARKFIAGENVPEAGHVRVMSAV